MIKTCLTAAALAISTIAIPATAFAEAPTKVVFHYAGDDYICSVKTIGDVRYVKGEMGSSHRPFHLRISTTEVIGDVDGNPVAFSTASVRPLTADRTLAAR